MMPDHDRFAIVGGRLALLDRIATGMALLVEFGRIVGILPVDSLPSDVARVDAAGRLVTPGLIDLHVHGALERSFADGDPDSFEAVLGFLAGQGVTSAQASLVSAPIDLLCAQLDAAAQYRPSSVTANLLGVHLEGPFLSAKQRGAHDPRALRSPAHADVQRLIEHGQALRMVTLAPELPEAVAAIKLLADRGVVTAVGHSAAGRSELDAAVQAGLTHITHLWSGQSNLTRQGPWRVPGLVECSLASEALTAEVIADGCHLPPELLTIAYRCLPGRLCLVSDGISGTGLPEGTRFREGGMTCEIRQGVSVLVGEDSFAGSTTPLNRMMRHLVDTLGWPLTDVVAMATAVPAGVLGLSDAKGSLELGHDADIAIFDDSFEPWAVMVAGKWARAPGGTTVALQTSATDP